MMCYVSSRKLIKANLLILLFCFFPILLLNLEIVENSTKEKDNFSFKKIILYFVMEGIILFLRL